MKALADIFISYTRADRRWAQAFAEILRARGFSVWFDSHLLPGERFRDAIAAELANAKCVLVLWTPRSVKSEFVLNEASDALTRKVIVPVMLEQAEIPIGFRERETAMLLDWEPGAKTPAFDQLILAIEMKVGKVALPSPPYPRRFWVNAALLALLGIGVALWLQLEVRPLIDGWVFLIAALAVAALIAFAVLYIIHRKYSRAATRTLIAAASILAVAHFLTPAPLYLVRIEPGKNLLRLYGNTDRDLFLSVLRDGKPLVDKKRYPTFRTIYLGKDGNATDEAIRTHHGDDEHRRQARRYMLGLGLDAVRDEGVIRTTTEHWIERREFWKTPPLRRGEAIEVVLQRGNGTELCRKPVTNEPGEVVPTVFIERP